MSTSNCPNGQCTPVPLMTPAHGGPQPGSRIRVPQIGKPMEPGVSPADVVQQLASGVFVAQHGGLSMDPHVCGNAPAWAIDLMNQSRLVHTEIAAITLTLFRRGLITKTELDEARAAINTEQENVYRQMVEQLGRQFTHRPAGKPTNPDDPRRSPSP